MTGHKVNFEPLGRRGKCQRNESLLSCARRLGVGITSLCGGQGTCQSCKVQIVSGNVSKPTQSELDAFSTQELKTGWRLACQTYPVNDCKINLPAESMTTTQRIQTEGWEIAVTPESPVKTYHIKLAPPSLSDLMADADRLLEALNQQYELGCSKVDLELLRALPAQLRDWNWQFQASVRDEEVIALGLWPSQQLGLAIDLGTTKIAGYLVDLRDGKTLAAQGVMNPQISHGEDIISRIASTINSPEQACQLQKLTVEAINQLAVDLCDEVGIDTGKIVEAVVVGNTAMHHLLLCLPVNQLVQSPFVPAVGRALDIKARDLGLHIAPGAYVHLLPNIAGFVGADHVAMLLATGAPHAGGITIAIDIGTNTEVSLVKSGSITTVSCASGPAFEGGHIKHGMRAASGAIEWLRVESERIQYQTVGEAKPIGICGSGILDAMSQLYLADIIDERGKLKNNHPRTRTHNNQREFVLVDEPDIVITQEDLRELQLAKAAIRTGIQVLLEANACSETEINQVIIAGAFGSYISIPSALAIGMLPSLPRERFRQVGNAAGMGAKLALISLSKRAEAQALASRVHYIELANAPNFNQTFIQASYLGRYRLENGKRRKIE